MGPGACRAPAGSRSGGLVWRSEHTHPVDEVVTVISGTFSLGMGETADQSKAQALPAGSFFALPPDTAHYVFIDEETIIQISTIGPWGLKYVNPEDDPRPKSQ